jgi:hypothetical protein
MATKPATTEEIERVAQRRQVVISREMLENLNLREGEFVAFKKQARRALLFARSFRW